MAPGHSHTNKRRKLDPRKHGVEELAFDPAARADYLTGFHKRKQQRLKHAAETAARRVREQQVADRRALREQRKADLEAHVQTVKAMMAQAEHGAVDSSDDEDAGEEDAGEGEEQNTKGEEQNDDIEVDEVEYVDEDRHTAVTIGPLDEQSSSEHGDSDDDKEEADDRRQTKQVPAPKRLPQNKQMRKTTSKKAFRYESPAERKAARSKQARRNSQAARVRKGGTR